MKYLALTLVALASTFTTPTVAAAAPAPTSPTMVASATPQTVIGCDREIARFLIWCWKA